MTISKQTSETNPDGTVKKKLRLGSSAFNAPTAVSTAQKTSPAKKAATSSTLTLASAKLGSIAENKTEEAAAQEVENKKKDETTEVKKPLKPESSLRAKLDEKKERERVEAERKRKEEEDKKEQERLEAEKKEEEERKRKEEEEAERKKKEEERLAKEAATKEVKIEIVIMSRVELEAAVQRIGEAFKDKKLPEAFEKIRAREILLESSRTKKPYNPKDQQPRTYFILWVLFNLEYRNPEDSIW